MFVQRTTKSPWYYYILWHLGRDEWSIFIEDLEFRVVNHWIGPTQLWCGNQVLAEMTREFVISDKKPILAANVRTGSTIEHSISIYAKAILSVKIRVEVDGEDISNGFV
jgi:hypothetical protein